jgi:hypothetical protein
MVQALVQFAVVGVAAHPEDVIERVLSEELAQIIFTLPKQEVRCVQAILIEIKVPKEADLWISVLLTLLIPGQGRLSVLTKADDLASFDGNP